jgi:hypothetical protein
MAEEQQHQDEDLEIVEVDQLPVPGETPKGKENEPETKEEGDEPDADEEGDDDERLADKDEDDKPEAQKKRAKRREAQKRARDAAQAEIRMLREQNQAFQERLSRLEGNQLSHTETTIDERISNVDREIAKLKAIHAAAIESGNGQDAVEALSLHSAAVATKADLENAKSKIAEQRNAPQGPDPNALRLANQWKAANGWYGSRGNEGASAVIDRIDAGLVAEGWNPKSEVFWQELSRRANAEFNAGQQGERQQRQDDAPPKKKGPPMSSGREHAPPGTRKEVYVTPERKQAMMEAGIWEDPERRKRQLKAYAEYDRNMANGAGR